MTDDNNQQATSAVIIPIPSESNNLHFYLIAFAIAACSPDDRIRALGCILFGVLIAAFLAVAAHSVVTRRSANNNSPD